LASARTPPCSAWSIRFSSLRQLTPNRTKWCSSFPRTRRIRRNSAVFLSDLSRHPRAEHGLQRRNEFQSRVDRSRPERRCTPRVRRHRQLELFLLARCPGDARPRISTGRGNAGRNAPVAIVSYSYWQKHDLNPGVLGSQLLIQNGRRFTIVGITPKGFVGTLQVLSPEGWLPMSVYDQVANDFESENKTTIYDRKGTQLRIMGRLKPGMTAAAAKPALEGWRPIWKKHTQSSKRTRRS